MVETVWDILPEEWLDDRAVLARRISTDAPMVALDLPSAHGTGSNEPMLPVNQEIGFVVTGYLHEWQKQLG